MFAAIAIIAIVCWIAFCVNEATKDAKTQNDINNGFFTGVIGGLMTGLWYLAAFVIAVGVIGAMFN